VISETIDGAGAGKRGGKGDRAGVLQGMKVLFPERPRSGKNRRRGPRGF